MRQKKTFTPGRFIGGQPGRRCACGHLNKMVRVCRNCGATMVRKPKPKRPARGADERVRLDLAHATKMVDEWCATVSRGITALNKWRAKERRLWDRIVEGPPPARPKKARKRRRAIDLKGDE